MVTADYQGAGRSPIGNAPVMQHEGNTRPAVVVTMSYSGLALARSLARQGVPVYALASSKQEVGISSRLVTSIIYPDILRSEGDTIDSLLHLARRIRRPAVLFPTGDALVLPMSRHRELLSEYYSFLLPEPDVLERLVSKQGLADIIRERNIPGPCSTTVMAPAQLKELEGDVPYPAIMKPVYSASWYRQEMVEQIGHRKVVVVENWEELQRWYSRIAGVDPRVILQEYIPGEDARLHYTCGYFDRDGVLEAIFAGQKLRVTPIHFGSASFVVSVRDDRLFKAATRLLQPLGYRGLFGVEFKLDPRDNIFKVIEVNARWGLWDGLARRCGVDLGYLAYARETGIPFTVEPDYRTGIKWLSFSRDLDAFLGYRKESSLSFWAWTRSLVGHVEHATFAWDDPMPSMVEVWGILRGKLRGLWSRLTRPKRSA